MSHDSFQHSANDGALLFFLHFFLFVPPNNACNGVAILAKPGTNIVYSTLPGLGTVSALSHSEGLSIHPLSLFSPGQVTRHPQRPCDQGISTAGGRVDIFQASL
jgi:hypothetical protein